MKKKDEHLSSLKVHFSLFPILNLFRSLARALHKVCVLSSAEYISWDTNEAIWAFGWTLRELYETLNDTLRRSS
jgi:hypothetical protein